MMRFIPFLALILLFITSSSAGPIAHLLPRPRNLGSYNQTSWGAKSQSSSPAIALQFTASSNTQANQNGGRASTTPAHSSNMQAPVPASSTPVWTPSGTTSRMYRSGFASSSSVPTSTPILQIIPVEEPTAASSSAVSRTTSLGVGIIQPLGSNGTNSSPTSVQAPMASPTSGTPSSVAYKPSAGAPSSSSAQSPATTPISRSSSPINAQQTPNKAGGTPTEAPVVTITLPGLENGTTPGPKPTPSPSSAASPNASTSQTVSPNRQSTHAPLEPTIVVVTIQPTPTTSPTEGSETSSSSSYTPSPTDPAATGAKATTTIDTAATTTQTETPTSPTPSDPESTSRTAQNPDPEVTIIKTTSTSTVLVYPAPTPSPTTSTSQQTPTPITPSPTSTSTSSNSDPSSSSPDEISIVPVTPGLSTVTETVTKTVTDKVTETMTVTVTVRD